MTEFTKAENPDDHPPRNKYVYGLRKLMELDKITLDQAFREMEDALENTRAWDPNCEADLHELDEAKKIIEQEMGT